MRIGPPASLSFLAIGVALVLLGRDARARSVAAACGVLVVAMATLSLTGYLYGAAQMYMIPGVTGIAFQTASVLLALGVAVVVSVPDREPMRTLLDPGAAGIVVRRALPVVVVVAFALGWLRVLIQNHGLVDTALGTALSTLVETALLTALLWWSAARVRTHEQARLASEVEVRRQAAELATFVDTAAIGLHRVGPDGVILWANDAELETLGYAREEYVGHHIGEFHADQAVLADILDRLHRGERLLEYPAQMRCKDGSLKAVLIDSSVLWEEGRFVHTQCFTRDVTDRRRAEQARALLAAIVEASDDAVVSKTLEGVITSWNAGAARIFGYSAAEAVGRHIDLIVPPDRLEEERGILRRLRGGEHIESLRDRPACKGRTPARHLAHPVADPGCVGPGDGRVEDRARHHGSQARGAGARGEQSSQGRVHRDPGARAAQSARAVRNAARYLKLAGPHRAGSTPPGRHDRAAGGADVPADRRPARRVAHLSRHARAAAGTDRRAPRSSRPRWTTVVTSWWPRASTCA